MGTALVDGLFVFMLAGFIGFEVIKRISPLLHTPLMSITNALDAIAVVGAMVLAIGGTLLQLGIEGKLEHIAISYGWIFVALGIGTAIGVPLGLVQMTAVPQRTALSHAFGAFCVTLVGTAEYYLGGTNIPPF